LCERRSCVLWRMHATLGHEEAKGRTAREAWRARVRLLEEQVGTSNAAQVRRSSSHVPLDLPLMEGPPPWFRSARKSVHAEMEAVVKAV
jgi:hypothetical protein